MSITGKDLIADEMNRDNHFGKANYSTEDILTAIANLEPLPIIVQDLQTGADVNKHYNITAESELEIANLDAVKVHVNMIAKLPTVKAIGIMPDACPSGGILGTIPVGGVVVTDNTIHPGMHSSDICCSVATTYFPSDTNPTDILDAAMKLCHFGPGGRKKCHDIPEPSNLLDEFEQNRFLRGMREMSTKHLGTIGDGNHFLYVGRVASTGQIALVTHHGSRGPGAQLYKRGMAAAEAYTKVISPNSPHQNSWLSLDTEEGQGYWNALELMRRWTKKNHQATHRLLTRALGLKDKNFYWNTHNFVYRRDNLIYHAKGATPNVIDFESDSSGYGLIPLNMTAPILITKVNQDRTFGLDFDRHNSLGFCPHGAGRLQSRRGFTESLGEKGLSPKEMIAKTLDKYDVRAFSGKFDITEFTEAYKNPQSIIDAIRSYNLTEIADMIDPIGCIMYGREESYRDKKKVKKEKLNYIDSSD